jgi:histone H1/5
MAPKAAAAAPKAKAASGDHASYQDMIKDAIINLKDRSGSSRVALKKYVKANNKITAEGAFFDSLFNRALKSGVDKGVFAQPKGSSGGTKLAAPLKKEAKPKTEKKAAAPKAKKAAAPKKTAVAKPKAAPKAKKAAAPKKEAKPKVTKAKAAPKPKKAAAPKAAPAIVEKPAVLGKTKSGRVTKTTSKTATPKAKKAAAPKKPAVKKATPKKAAA